MPQVVHFWIKSFETSCLCFDCLSAPSQPSSLMWMYVPGSRYSVYFNNLPYFASQTGYFPQCLLCSDINVRPAPQGLCIRLTWPLIYSLQNIFNEFICTSMCSITLVHALSACHPSEIAVRPGGNGVWNLCFRCVYSTFSSFLKGKHISHCPEWHGTCSKHLPFFRKLPPLHQHPHIYLDHVKYYYMLIYMCSTALKCVVPCTRSF